MEDVKSIKVTSEDLHDGKWDDSISNTDAGENASPQLSWERVPGAEEYAIYGLHAWVLFVHLYRFKSGASFKGIYINRIGHPCRRIKPVGVNRIIMYDFLNGLGYPYL